MIEVEKILTAVLNALLYSGAAFLVSVLATKLCILYLPKWGLVDNPGGRHIHKQPTPRGGGLAIIFSFFLVSSFHTLLNTGLSDIDFLADFSLPALVILAGGILDDRFALSSKVKLLFQIIAGVLFWVVGARLNAVLGIELHPLLGFCLTVLWTVTIINAFNLIDGMDGVAAGLGCVAAVSLSIWGILLGTSATLVTISLILAASCAGFLRYNFSPAKIFMGDTGSMFLGLFFAYAGLNSFGKSATIASLLIPVLAVGVPLFDVSLAFWRRLVRKFLHPENASGIMSADLQHLHHRLFQELNCSRRAALRIYLLACALVGTGFFAFYFEKTIPALGYAAIVFLLLYILRRVAKVELYDSTLLLKNRLSRSRKLLVILAALPFLDLVSLLAAAIFAKHLLLFEPGGDDANPLLKFALLSIPTIFFLFITGNYRIFWARAGYEDLRKLVEGSICGLVASCLLFYAVCTVDHPLLRSFFLIFSLLSFLGIGMVRVCIVYFGMRTMWGAPPSTVPGERSQLLLLYGGGLNAALYITFCCNHPKAEPFRALGIIDDDKTLDGMTVFGLPVLGNSCDLPRIFEEQKVDKLVLTINSIPAVKLEELCRLTERYQVELSRFRPEETSLQCPDGRIEN